MSCRRQRMDGQKDEILTHHIMEAMDTTKQEDFCIYCQRTGTWKLSGRHR